MAVTWTEEQKQVIEDRNHNLLVSAAAGSGKTAVLVERILERVTDPKDPIDVDQLLVVTFTRAAAGEMKERLRKALEKKLEEDPDSDHLQKQGVLLHNAQINTIHGFCQHVIRNYFHCINLDPSYRIAQESELRLMKGDILDRLMEDEYALLLGKQEDSGKESVVDSESGNLKDSASEKAETAGISNVLFGKLVEAYSPGRNDARIPEMILSLYNKAISNPDPDAWLDSCLADYRIRTEAELENSAWMKRITGDTILLLESSLGYAEKTLALAKQPGGPSGYLAALESDIAGIQSLCRVDTFGDLQIAFEELEFQKLGRSSKAEAALEDPDLKILVKKRRDALKKSLSDWQKKYFCDTEEEILEDLSFLEPFVAELVRLTREFTTRFIEAKKSKNLADFSDLEHYALKILLEKKDGTLVRTEAARELAAGFREVMVDEYQDSNLIQEALLQAVSGEEEGRHDRFMVGDMKQAIYGFRLARPEIFLEKYYRYGEQDEGRVQNKEDGQNQEDRQNKEEGCRRIDLDKNFRSRREVLDPVNALFRRLMQKSLGGILYDDSQALHLGAVDYPDAGGVDTAELLLLDSGDPALAETQISAAEAEALAIAGRIHSLMKDGKVYDRDTGALRPVHYRDIVVLLRSTASAADIYVKTLKDAGIPAYSVSKEGYFSTLEVETVLNYLRLVDNTRQDEALASVLHSPIGDFTAGELAEIAEEGQKLPEEQTGAERKAKKQKQKTFYQKVFAFLEWGQEGSLKAKLQEFFRQLNRFRKAAADTPVHQLIEAILENTGYGSYAAAMPGGAQREANLKMLVDMAAAFEDGSQHGLFAFIRSIEEQNKYQIDAGEVNLYSENEDIVRIMTIHKSKGLEFPVVFLANCGKKFNRQDSTAAMVLHPSLGIGLDAVDAEKRLKRTTIRRAVLARAAAMDNLAEELRVLYVAMTRAKEKLIMTGAVKDLDKLPEDIARAVRTSEYEKTAAEGDRRAGTAVGGQPEQGREEPEQGSDEQEQRGEEQEQGGDEKKGDSRGWDTSPIDYGTLTSANSYLDWILAAYSYGMPIKVMTADAAHLVKVHEQAEQGIEEKLDELKKQLSLDRTFDPEVKKFLEERSRYSYPYKDLLELPAKMTVSEIKKTAYDAETAAILGDVEERGQDLIPEGKNGFPEEENSYSEAGTDFYVPTFVRRMEQEGQDPAADNERGHAENPAASTADQDNGGRKHSGASLIKRERSRGASAGAARGTIYHAFMEHLDYSAGAAEDTAADKGSAGTDEGFAGTDEGSAGEALKKQKKEDRIRAQLEKLVADGVFSREDANLIRRKDFVTFLDSDLGRRMAEADRRGQLHREAPFVLEVNAHTIRKEWPEDQSVLVQGVIDAWFFEGDKIVLVDYKTDHVYTEDGSDLIRKYHDQFRYYRKALEQLAGARVKEMQLYSFGLGKAIEVK
ncbi:MAG: UvrD-helicase domain-containing protein [Eubacterium sp.]|nr:UvrD-helicase domain-containing protein [Eubacterium sp.]